MRSSSKSPVGLIACLLMMQAATSVAQDTAQERIYARVGDVEVSVADVQAAVDAAGARTRADVQAIADELVQHEVLLWEATRRGLADHVLVRDEWRTQMVQRFMRIEFDSRLRRDSITDEMIQQRYDADPSAYIRGLPASAEGIRGTLWRERRDRAVDALMEECETRTPVTKMPRLLDLLPETEEEPLTPQEQFQAGFGCAHCARQLERDPQTPTTVFGSPVPEVPDWARRRTKMSQ